MDRKLFLEADFDEEHLDCPYCDWRGRGDESVIIDFYGITRNQEVRCPECDAIIGRLRRHSDRDAGM